MTLLLLAACGWLFDRGGDDTAAPSDDDTGALDTADTAPPDTWPPDSELPVQASVDWTSSGVSLLLAQAIPESHRVFGMAETGCGDPTYCWYGEDCIYGDLSGSYFYCHPIGSTGATLMYGGDFSSLAEGTETVFGGPSFDGTVTYYLELGGACRVWGHDPSYYAGLGCQPL